MITTEALTSAGSTLAEEAKHLLPEHKESHRARALLVGAALIAAAAAAYRYLRSRLAGQAHERVIDLTQDPVVAPESLPTH